ncbi:MAG: DUF3768 domain-containing protein [Alphaproteobacteria bacterium]|nr:MAG: DUF3768 domain-containing protein [Alphaproteobacteria bacterium]
MGVSEDDVAGDIGAVPRCASCGSQRVVRDAWAAWNPDTGLWELSAVFDREFCQACEGETTFVWARQSEPPRGAIRELNDRFRTSGQGNGSVVITRALAAKGEAFVTEVLAAVRSFSAFSEDCDPWGEHDFGALEVAGEKIFWKIDYYDPSLSFGSENPANEALTHRVLTIMLASEY